MSDSSWERIKAIVGHALELTGDEREAFLQSECGVDEALRFEVEALLAIEGDVQPEFLEPPPVEHERGLHLGEFELIRELGRGGMAVVYLARQARLRRDVAVKVFVAGLTTTEREIERFHREARATAKLQHPGIVQVFADGQSDATHWFAMEYIEGHDLCREIALQSAEPVLAADRSFLPRPSEAAHAATIARVCADVGEALHHAHGHGIVHRDVKPQNLLLQGNGRVQVVDFGLVRDESLGSLTRTGEIAGTPHYMSPEQARVRQAKVDHRTDIYSLGVVLYELATLQRPFEGETNADILTSIRDTLPRSPRARNPRIPRDLETICLKAMSKEASERYPTALAFAEDLRRFIAHEAIEARPPTWLERALRWTGRHRVRIAGAVLTLGGLGAGAWAMERLADARTKAFLSIRINGSEGEVLAGEVSLRALDPITGEAIEAQYLGRLPVEEVAVAPGRYRIVVDLDGERRVFTRSLRRGEKTGIHNTLSAHSDPTDMVFVVGGVLSLRDENAPLVALNNRDLELDSFWLDETEVSNAAYRQFLAATGHPAPPHWSEVKAEHDRLPVVNIGWLDARTFAEWNGKRLPSHAEWTWAARGAENRVYPWSGAVRGEYRGNVLHPSSAVVNSQRKEIYFESVVDVMSHADARTPSGLYHMFGNVAEMTETAPVELTERGFEPRPSDRIVAGHAWDAASVGRTGHSLMTFGYMGVERTHAEYTTGFRCARSIGP